MSMTSVGVDPTPLQNHRSIDARWWIQLIRKEDKQLHWLLEHILHSLPATANEYGKTLALGMYLVVRSALDSDDASVHVDAGIAALLLEEWREANPTVDSWEYRISVEKPSLYQVLFDEVRGLPDTCRGYAMDPPLAVYAAFARQTDATPIM